MKIPKALVVTLAACTLLVGNAASLANSGQTKPSTVTKAVKVANAPDVGPRGGTVRRHSCVYTGEVSARAYICINLVDYGGSLGSATSHTLGTEVDIFCQIGATRYGCDGIYMGTKQWTSDYGWTLNHNFACGQYANPQTPYCNLRYPGDNYFYSSSHVVGPYCVDWAGNANNVEVQLGRVFLTYNNYTSGTLHYMC